MAQYEIPGDLRYSTEDEWLRREGGRISIGITDYAQQQLGDIVFVELPEVGDQVERGESFGVVESVKAVSELYAPMTGAVVEVNDALSDRPELVNTDCYGDGWMITIAPSDEEEYEPLLSAAAYGTHIEERES